MKPLVSIIVPTLNQAAFIGQTLASIVGQSWPGLELIIIDGGSKDGTHEIVEQYASDVTHFVSEPDRGQADAINKGMKLAKGDVLAWLNSDDYYLPLAIPRAVEALGDLSKPALVHGGVLVVNEQRAEAAAWPALPITREGIQRQALVFQPAAFWTRALWEKTGEVNVDLHYTLDWDWFYRAFSHAEFRRLEHFFAFYRFHDAHKTGSGNPRRTREVIDFVETHAGPEWGAAFRDVAAQLDTLPGSLARLRRWRLFGLRRLVHRDLYARHGDKVKIALQQLHV